MGVAQKKQRRQDALVVLWIGGGKLD